MNAAPAGFTLLPGTERPGGAVFDVERDGRSFVCKRLGPRARAEPWLRERLKAEGGLLGRLDGSAAPRLVAAGEDGAGPWIVMEQAEGRTLAERVEQDGPAQPDEARRAAEAAFEALATVHAAGVVHGDVSPDNVLVDDTGARVILVDFGLAIAAGMPPMPAGPFRGTPAYAAPEVARGEPFGASADVFGMAASVLFLASGEPPRPDAPEAAMILRAAEEPVTPWALRAAARLDPALGRALVTCCAFDPCDRPVRLGTSTRLP
ncbi:MAG TPA: serine/threonine-protein kinase [Polyangiaceae bacterium]|jgi:serine/threonine protein kinase